MRFQPIEERFWPKVNVAGADDCWLWNACTDRDGYGLMWRNKQHPTVFAHRICYEVTRGRIPDGYQIMHRCDRPQCVNPAHLTLGTHADNVADKMDKGRGKNGYGKIFRR